MKNAIILKIGVLGVLAFGAACQTAKTESVSNPAPANSSAPADVKPSRDIAPETTKPEAIEPAINAPSADKQATSQSATPTQAYKAAYAARRNKDVAALKRMMSKDALEFMSIFVKPGQTVDDALLKMTETPQAATDESRNEKITGDTATLEYPDESRKWKTMDFVKEDGEWKLTIPRPQKGADTKNK